MKKQKAFQICENYIGQHIDKLREEALKKGFAIQIVKQNNIWSSTKWITDDITVHVATMNATITEILNDESVNEDKQDKEENSE